MKKMLLLSSMFLLNQYDLETKNEQKSIVLSSPLLRVADNAGIFHGPILDILQTRIDIVNLIQGEKKWNGAIVHCKVNGNNQILKIYCRRPEILYGATFIAVSPDHELVETLTTQEQKAAVKKFVNKTIHQTLYDRQMNSNNEGVFSGSYAINPLTKGSLPIYISDYAIESFDTRHAKTRLGIPAHNSKDLDFAKEHNLAIKIVVDVQNNLQDKNNDLGPVCAAPLLDKNGQLKEAYLGEYSACIITNSDILNNSSLKDAAAYVIDFLESHNLGHRHTECLQYSHNNQLYSIKDLAKIETTIYKNSTQNTHINELKKDIKIALTYAQADLLEIVEKFIINVKNTKTLMIALIEEDCDLRGNPNCYLLQWSKLKGNDNEKDIFRRDITSLKELTIFCKDLVNFLGDFAHSCPKALENIRKQNQ
jgi:hypothetical protein